MNFVAADPIQTDHSVQKSLNAFRTISEVAAELNVPQHVLRFWESKFPQIKPLKRAGGRRYYRPDDVNLLRGIRGLLYGDGYTIKGVQKVLKEKGPRFVSNAEAGAGAPVPETPAAQSIPAGDAAPLTKTAGRGRTPRSNPDEMSLPMPLPEFVKPGTASPELPPRRPKAAETTGINPMQRKKLEKLLSQLHEIQRMLENP